MAWQLRVVEGPEGPVPTMWVDDQTGAQYPYIVEEGVGVAQPPQLANSGAAGVSIGQGQTIANEGVERPTISATFMGKTPEQWAQGLQVGGYGQGGTINGEPAYVVDIGNQTFFLPQSAASGLAGAVPYINYQNGGSDSLFGLGDFIGDTGGKILIPLAAAAGAGMLSGLGAGGLSGASGLETFYGSALGDPLLGATGLESLAGTAGLDQFYGSSLGDPLLGGAGDIPASFYDGLGGVGGGADIPASFYDGLEGVGNTPASLYDGLNGVGTTPTQTLPATVGPSATGGTGTTANASTGALTRILNGQGTTDDYLDLLGKVAPGLISAYGSTQQGDALQAIADRARADRQPFLNQSLAWLNDPAAYAAGPGKSALDATLRALSVNGNPIDNPTSLAIASDVANRNWQNAVTGFANIGLAGEDKRLNLETNAATAGNIWPGLGDAAASVLTQSDNSALTNLLKRLNQGSYLA